MAARLCIEPDCTDIGNPRCPAHAATRRPPPRQRRLRNVERDARRGTTTQRGYGAAHRRRRAQLLPAAIGTACPLCEESMLEGQRLNLHHSTPQAHGNTELGDQIVHARCDQSAGGRTRRR